MTTPAARRWQGLRDTIRHPHFRIGVRDMAGVNLGLSAWALVTGVAMVKGGLSVPLALLMTFTVYAGSAQLTAIPMIAAGAPLWVIWAAAVCVNLRFVIFSAQWRPFFRRFPLKRRLLLGYLSTDLSFVMFIKRFQGTGADAEPLQMPYFWGSVSLNWLSWQVFAVAGILMANAVPTHWGLGFAGVLALLGLSYSLVSDRVTALSALVAGAAAVAAFALPLRLNILVAIAAGVCAGLLLDRGRHDDAGRRMREALAPDKAGE